MATWQCTDIIINGLPVKAQTPLIISASRSTDIPAFYADWFFHRLQKGYSAWTNPFNGIKSYVSYEKTLLHCILVKESTTIVAISAYPQRA